MKSKIYPLGSNFYNPDIQEDFEKNQMSFNLLRSSLLKEARQKAKLDFCYYCGKKVDGFCNSHSIPRFCLDQITLNGYLYHSSAFTDIPLTKETMGINSAGVFRLICRECDSYVFSEYENPDNYSDTPSQIMLSQIALKNYLYSISKRHIEIKLYYLMKNKAEADGIDIMAQLVGGMNIQKSFDAQIEISKIDLKNFMTGYEYAKNLIHNPTDRNNYHIIYLKHLDYIVPITFQNNVALISDFFGNMLNDIYNLDNSFSVKDVHIAIFPLKTESVIFVFCESNHCQHFSKFEKKLNAISLEEQLSTINYIAFAYSEDVFASKTIPSKIIKCKAFQKVARQNTSYYCFDNSAPPLDEAKKIYNLNNRKSIPNLLDMKYARK